MKYLHKIEKFGKLLTAFIAKDTETLLRTVLIINPQRYIEGMALIRKNGSGFLVCGEVRLAECSTFPKVKSGRYLKACFRV